jgi:hypothetical protein
MTDFRGFKSMRGPLMNIGYQFKIVKDSDEASNRALFLSVIIDPVLGKKGNWRINEFIDKLRIILSKI